MTAVEMTRFDKICIHSFVHSKKINVYYVPVTVLDIGNRAINKDKVYTLILPYKAYILIVGSRQKNKLIKHMVC